MYNIGIFGSAGDFSPELAPRAEALGAELAAHGCAIITGACSGVPYLAAHAAARAGARVFGFSPVANLEEQREFTPNDDLSIYTSLHFIPRTFPYNSDLLICKKYRNALSTAHCDAGIIIAGAWGTLNEFTNLIDFGKVIGVMAASGGVANIAAELAGKIGVETHARLVIASAPAELADRVLAELGSSDDHQLTTLKSY